MNIDLKIENGISNYHPMLEDGVTLEWVRKNSPGKLKFSCIKDGNNVLSFQEGDKVYFTLDGRLVFKGRVFAKSRSGKKPNIIEVTAYDQLRYFKNKDTMDFDNMKVGEYVRQIAASLKISDIECDDSKYVIPHRTETDLTYFDMVQNAVDLTMQAEHVLYVLYDDAGRLKLKSTENMKLDTLISEKNAVDYSYESSIDKQTYNSVWITDGSKADAGDKTRPASDEANIKRWGLLRYTGSTVGREDAQKKANDLLKKYNSKTRTLSISDAIGDIRVRGGSRISVNLKLGDIDLNDTTLLVEQVTHKFKNNAHLMDLKLRGGTFGD